MAIEYSQEIAEYICARLTTGVTLRALCREDGMPDETSVRMWALNDINGFGPQYARARQIGYLSMADEIVDESRTPRIGEKRKRRPKKDGKDGETEDEIEFGDAVDRSRLHVDTLKWLLSKALPKIYGPQAPIPPAPPEGDNQTFVAIVPAKAASEDEWVSSTQPQSE